MGKRYKEWTPRQVELLAQSPSDWLPDDDLAYYILDTVERLDLSAIEAVLQAKDPRGTRPYDPRLMVGLLLLGYCVGVTSSRKIERATHRDVSFRVLSGGQHPDHTVISEFRRVHLRALQGLFGQTVQVAQEMGIVQLGRVALDGTKMRANASKHKAMSYERMKKKRDELQADIEAYFAEAERVDREEDALYGKDRRGDELPPELRNRAKRLAKLDEVMAALEAEAARSKAKDLRERAAVQREHAQDAADAVERKRAATRAGQLELRAAKMDPPSSDDNDDDPEPPPASSGDNLPSHRVPATPDGKPKGKAQRNFTDPDSRIMKQDGAFIQGYNAQAVAESSHQIIVGCAVTNQAPDQEHLLPLVEEVQKNCGDYPEELLADAGYWAEDHVGQCEKRGIDPYIATGRLKHGESPPATRGRIPKDLDAKGRMYRKLRTKRGREAYARRKAIVEPVFGQMKEAQGLRRFLLRGVDKVRGEWALMCASHNLRKLHLASLAAGRGEILEQVKFARVSHKSSVKYD